jgi:hypothetical protein
LAGRAAGFIKPLGCVLLSASILVPLWACQATAFHGTKALAALNTPPSLEIHASRGAAAVQPLVAAVWTSGFFRRNEVVRNEFANNDYAVFGKDSDLADSERNGLACFSKARGRRDAILFRADIVSYCRTTPEGLSEPAFPREKLLAVLVHELCHDLWENVLDAAERAMFAVEGEEFVEDFLQAKTEEEQRLFLQKAGEADPGPGDIRPYSGLEALVRSYPAESRFGPELFAWLGEQAYTRKSLIPLTFRKYFCGLFSDFTSHAVKSPR